MIMCFILARGAHRRPQFSGIGIIHERNARPHFAGSSQPQVALAQLSGSHIDLEYCAADRSTELKRVCASGDRVVQEMKNIRKVDCRLLRVPGGVKMEGHVSEKRCGPLAALLAYCILATSFAH